MNENEKNENLEISRQVGQTIAKYRKAAGLSQAKVAELLDISNDAVSRMERGTIVLSVSRLFEFAKLFNCRAADLLTDSQLQPLDQVYQLERMLSELNFYERQNLVKIIEQMIEWKRDNGG